MRDSRLDIPVRNHYIFAWTDARSNSSTMGATSMKSTAFFLLMTAVVVGCDDSTGPDSSRGNAPVVTSFTFSPDSAAYYPWGGTTTVRGSVAFSDIDGDLATLLLSITPGGSDTIAVPGAAGITAGTLVGELRVATGAVGSFNVTATLIDSKGNRSNPASKVFRVARDRSGASWGYRPSGTTAELLGVAASESMIVAVGAGGTIMTSPDGREWTPRTSGISAHLRAVAWSGQRFIAVGDNLAILVSPDGMSWVPASAPRAEGTLCGVTAGGGLIVAVGSAPMLTGASTDTTVILTSPDGLAWTDRGPSLQYRSLQSVAWSGTRFVATALQESFPADVIVLTSPNGLTWAPVTLPGSDYSIFDITWTGSTFVTAGTGGVSFVSGDGEAWQRYTLDATTQYGVASAGGPLVTVGWNILTSQDGRTWNRTAAQVTQRLRDVIWHDFQYIAVGEGGAILVSPPGDI